MKRTFAQKLLMQGIAASKAGQPEDARRLLRQAVDLDPDNENAWLWLSGAVDTVSERRECLERVLLLNPDHAHARAGLAWLERLVTQAASLKTTPRDPADIEDQSAHDAGASNACPFCKSLVSAGSTSCGHCHCTLIVLCPVCETRLEIEKTLCSVCGHPLGDFRQGASYYATLGDAYLANLKATLAIGAWHTVLEIDPSYPDAHLKLGEAQMMVSNWDRAQASLERAVAQATDPTATRLAVGGIFEKYQQWEAARRVYEEALAMDMSSAAAQFALGRLLMEGKALQDAFPHLRRATQLDSGNSGAWFLLGQLYEAAEEGGKALRAYENAVKPTGGGRSKDNNWRKFAAERLELLRPSLPPHVALNWPETFRQTAGMALIPAVAALINAGLRPWQISPMDYLAVLVATLGAYFWVSASTLPRNPGMRAMLGRDGLSSPTVRAIVSLFGVLFWATGLLYILLAPALTHALSAG